MLLKHVYMGWKFQRTLKLSMSFSLEHFFISVAISTQVASAPLIVSLFPFLLLLLSIYIDIYMIFPIIIVRLNTGKLWSIWFKYSIIHLGFRMGIWFVVGIFWFDCTAKEIKFSIKDFFSKFDQIRRKLQIWSHLLKKSLMENFIFCAVLLWTSIDFSLFIFNHLKLCKIFNNYDD